MNELTLPSDEILYKMFGPAIRKIMAIKGAFYVKLGLD